MIYIKKIALLVSVMVAIVAGSMLVSAQEADAVTLPQVAITVTADGITMPETMPEGMVEVSFDNQGEAPLLPVLARLREDVTQELFMDTIMTGGPDAALALVSLQGGTMIFPGIFNTITYDLAAGEYVMIDFAAEMPSMNWFTVEDGEGDGAVVEMDADVTVSLYDFAFAMPVTLNAGENLWRIQNKGGQWHEIAIMRVDETQSLADVRETLLNAEGGPDGPMPDFLWMPMSEGEQALLNITLEPGTYAVLCHLPDVVAAAAAHDHGAENMPHTHAELGMMQIITVK